MTIPSLRDVPDSFDTERLTIRCPRAGEGPLLHEAVVASLDALREFPASLPWAMAEPTLETLAAVALLRELIPDLRVRVINVVDLMKLQPKRIHPEGLEDAEFDALFTRDKPIVFAFHGYPWLIHRLAYKRTNHANLHVRGYVEEGTTTTPFDMTVLNGLDRFHLVMDVIERVPRLEARAAGLIQTMREKLIEHRQYVNQYGDDMPEIKNWKWNGLEKREERRTGKEQE